MCNKDVFQGVEIVIQGEPLVAVRGREDWNVQLAWEECHRGCTGGVRVRQGCKHNYSLNH